MSHLETDREEYVKLIASLQHSREVPRRLLSKANLDRFSAVAREKFHADDGPHVRQLVERIQVDGT